jgi:ectoine hydroxylase-related dioxygenase (phytanoyl-CoA dioxygenase family)
VSEIERVEASAGVEPLIAALDRDGVCVVAGALTSEQLSGLNGELDDVIAANSPESRNPNHPTMDEFYGSKTIRLDGVPDKSATFVEFLNETPALEVCDHFLKPSGPDYLLNTSQLIQIGPGETAQRLHRDENAWPKLEGDNPHVSVMVMLAPDEFTMENGATRAVPGSHLWDRDRIPEPSEIAHAAMDPGHSLFWLGGTIHGGGANTTKGESRRGLGYGFVVGWMRTAENLFLTVPIEKVREMPTRVQELLGYKSLFGLGVVNVGSPMALLD